MKYADEGEVFALNATHALTHEESLPWNPRYVKFDRGTHLLVVSHDSHYIRRVLAPDGKIYIVGKEWLAPIEEIVPVNGQS